jgi:hypothetical protein
MRFCETNPVFGDLKTALASGALALQIGPAGRTAVPSADSGQAPTAATKVGLLREKDGNLYTLHLTIEGVGGSIVGQSCQERVGDVAQLVERRNGIAEATGSTPVVSTNPLLAVSGGFPKALHFFPIPLH